MAAFAVARTNSLLSRTSSASSVASADTVSSVDDSDPNIPSVSRVDREDAPRRTRKRFTSTQLMILEHLYHQSSHPTREQREVLATEAGIELRSVTVWFQNKRQMERKVALSNAPPVPPDANSAPSHARSRSRSPTPSASTSSTRTSSSYPRTPPLSASPTSSSYSSTRTVRSYTHTHPPTHRSRPHLSSRAHRRPSLDHIATRAERPAPRTPKASTMNLGDDDGGGGRNIWETMPSSPLSPSSPESGHDRDLELLDFSINIRGAGGSSSRAKPTLEWACAAARVSRRSLADENEVRRGGGRAGTKRKSADSMDELLLDDMDGMDVSGDTDVEDPHEAVTPNSSQGSLGPPCRRGNDVKKMAVREKRQDVRVIRDNDVMDAALALCGLGGSLQR